MRSAIASLILAAALGSAAQAQVPSTAPAAPATTAPAPETAPAAPATPPAAPSATPTAPAAEAAPAPPAPALPTTGDGAALISVIDRVCVPLVRGGNLDELGKAVGMKKNRRDSSWSMGLGGDRNYTITIFAPGSNKDVCRGEVHYAVNQTEPFVQAMNIWSFLHQPELVLQANYVKVYDDGIKRVQRSWEHLEPNSSVAVNFTTLTKPDDTALSGKYSAAEFYYQERKF
jgi:hypothetical protein